MDIFKSAVKLSLRFSTSRGVLTTEQLFHLNQTEIASLIKGQKKILNKDNEDDLGFLDSVSKVDETEQLKFDILKDVYLTKKSELEVLKSTKETKEHNQKIMELINSKKEGELQSKSIEELTVLLK